MLPYLLGLAASLSTYAGGLLALRFVRQLDLLLGLTAGLVIGLALLDLLPEALESGAGIHAMSTIMGIMAAGVALYLLLHRLPAGSLFGRASLILHSLMDGLSIGLAFQLSSATGWLVAIAVLAHDMADGANMVGLSVMRDEAVTARNWLMVNAAVPFAGVVIGQAVHVDLAGFSLLLALFAGGFLYIGASELLPRCRDTSPGVGGGVASATGLALMACIVHFAA
ncbi:MAG: ZIP family metal transporter [Sphingobium sp.]|nr:ZIP family metal transporter [Sphingobium sp.]